MKNYKVLLRSFKKSVSFVEHQTKSFDEFIDARVQKKFDYIVEI